MPHQLPAISSIPLTHNNAGNHYPLPTSPIPYHTIPAHYLTYFALLRYPNDIPNPNTSLAYIHPTSNPNPFSSPQLTLSNRNPTLNEIKDYLVRFSNDEFNIQYSYYEGERKGILINGETVSYLTQPDRVMMLYADVNGDQAEDLILSDNQLVIIFIWSGNVYESPFIHNESYWYLFPSSQVYLQDWTLDGIPEVVFEYRDHAGGTGLYSAYWTRHIIQCTEKLCHIIWSGIFASDSADLNSGGIYQYSTDFRLTTNEQNQPTIRYLSQAFSLYSGGEGHLYPIFIDNYQYDGLNIFTSTLSIFEWDGFVFTLTDEQIYSLPQAIPSQSVLQATNLLNNHAQVKKESLADKFISNKNDECTLLIDGIKIGDSFGCKENFVQVSWQDITSDGIEEVVLVALSGAYGWQGESLTEKGCTHQRLLAYTWQESVATEIANVTGCVIQSDLYGVRLRDYENDGQLEIFAADTIHQNETCYGLYSIYCWYELGYRHEIYKWNGQRFVFWDDIPDS